MKYVKLFEQHADYEVYKNGGDYITPNVSYCVDNNEVHYEKFYDPYNGHEYIDLGLPSGTLWAKCNVGATTETDYGMYFQWGETTGYTQSQVGTDKNFTWSDYSMTSDNGSTMDKYNSTDGLTTLELTDDAAHVNMGGEWKMPTSTQIEELCNTDNASHVVVNDYNGSGVSGMLFTSVTNNATLFVPFSGVASDGSVDYTGYEGNVWASSLSSSVNHAFYLYVYDTPDAGLDNRTRYFGFSVRGVVSSN